MNRLEIAVACAPMFRHRFDFSDLKEDAKRLAELAFAQADALIEKLKEDEAKAEEELKKAVFGDAQEKLKGGKK